MNQKSLKKKTAVKNKRHILKMSTTKMKESKKVIKNGIKK